MAEHQEISYLSNEDANISYTPNTTVKGVVHPKIAELYASRDTFSEDRIFSEEETSYQDNLIRSKFDHDAYRAKLVADFQQRNKEAIQSTIESADPQDEIISDLEIIPSIVEQQTIEAQSILNADFAIVDSEAPADMPRSQKLERAAALNLQRVHSKFAEGNEEWYDIAIDIAGYVLPDTIFDQAQIEGFDPDTVIQTYRGMDPLQKVIFINDLAQQAEIALDENKIKISELISFFGELEGASDLSFIRALDVFDIATITGPILFKTIGKSINMAMRQANPIKNASSKEMSGTLNAAALESEEVAEAMLIDRSVAVLNANHFPNEQVLSQVTPDIANEAIAATARQSMESTRNLRDQGKRILDKDFVVSHQIVDDEALLTKFNESKVILQQQLDTIEDEIPILMGEFKISNLDNTGFTAEIPYADSSGNLGDVTHTIRFGEDEVGMFGQLPTFDVARGFVFSPKYLLNEKGFRKTVGQVVETGELRDTAQGRYIKAMSDMYTEALSPIAGKTGSIPKKTQRRVEAVMQTLDEMGTRGHRPTPRELVVDGITVEDRIQGLSKIRLTPNEAQVVYNLAEVADFAAIAENNAARATKILNKESFFQFGTYEKYGKEVLGIGKIDSGVKEIYDSSKGVRPLDEITNELIENEGKVLVKFTDNLAVPSKSDSDIFHQYRYALVREDEFLEIPEQVLNTRDFYVTKVTPNVRYVIKEHKAGTVNGNPGVARATTKTIELFDGDKAATTRLSQLEAEAPKGITYEKLRDRQYSLTGDIGEDVSSSGTLFTGARATHDLKFGLESIRPDRVPAFTAIQRNLQHLSNKMSRNEWRFDMQTKWKKSATEAGVGMEGKPVTKFDAPIDTSTPEGRTLEFIRTYIRQQMKIPDKQESLWEGTTRGIADWMEGKSLFEKDWNLPFKEIPVSARGSVMYLSQTDPIAATRALTFHALLGWYNPAQFFVQAQNASIVTGLAPRVATKAISEYLSFRALIFSPNKKTMQHRLSNLPFDKATKEDMIEEVLAAQRTGYFDTLTNNSDMSAALSGMGGGLFRKAAQEGLRPYKGGELASRAIAWKVAWKQARLENPTKKFTDEDIKNIFSQANDFNLNMNRANRAAFETNQFTALGGQFYPVITKWVEKMLPSGSGGWTYQEKFKMLFGQGMLYGAAGIPGGAYILNEAAEALNTDVSKIGKKELALYTQGLTGFLFGQGELQVSPRSAIGTGLEETILSALNEESTSVALFLGASRTMFGRASEAMNALLAPMFTEVEWPAESWIKHISLVPATISSFNNAQKAYFMAVNKQYYDRKYSTIIDRKFSLTEMIGQGLGFRITEADTFNKAQLNRRDRVEYISKISDEILIQMNHFARLSSDNKKERIAISDHVAQLIASHPEGDQAAIRRNIVNAMRKKPKSIAAFTDVFKNSLNSQTDLTLQAKIYQHVLDKPEE